MSRFAGLPAALKATTAAAKEALEDVETDDEGDGAVPPAKSKKKEPEMADENQNAAVDTAKKEDHDAGFKAATDRFNAVMASEHYAGREAAAGKLLTNASMFNASADDITGILADMPKIEKTELSEEEQREAAETGGRKEMQEQLQKGANSSIEADAGNGGAKNTAAEAAGIWDRATARVFPEARK
ncbi:MAG: hypothetical protein JNM03_10560 [Sphingopyxis sp.]|uniref:hypothetical protein n=1 Tax=Sphingopyxis sp. TaxID=1908224 RepID=UPI001A4520E5|nr:hypothetical protein [Sphingopyxis sp.]MBL9070419.1 hypothetical protein [Sphingopyxis sp.]